MIVSERFGSAIATQRSASIDLGLAEPMYSVSFPVLVLTCECWRFAIRSRAATLGAAATCCRVSSKACSVCIRRAISEHLPLLKFLKCCIFVGSAPCCGFVTRGSATTLGDLLRYPTPNLLDLPQYTRPATTHLSHHNQKSRPGRTLQAQLCFRSGHHVKDLDQCKDDLKQAKDPTAMEKKRCCLSEPLHMEG